MELFPDITKAKEILGAPRFDAFKKHLDTIAFLKDVRLNIAIEQDNKSFLKLKIKVRDKIVASKHDLSTLKVLGSEVFSLTMGKKNQSCL